jgi:uronate dehydrogenase
MKRVLWVGATGLVGSEVVPLLKEKFPLVLAARESGEIAGLSVKGVDITDYDSTLAMLQAAECDAVVNCAIADYTARRRGSPEAARAYNESAIEVNVRGAYHLYEAAARCGVKKYVFVSSMTAILGVEHERVRGDEPPAPHSPYACTKLFGEQLGFCYADKFGMSVTCLRLGQPFPMLDVQRRKQLTDPKQRAIHLHMEDIAQAVELALRETAPHTVYPIVSGGDEPWVEAEATAALGYVPRYLFTTHGPILRENPSTTA